MKKNDSRQEKNKPRTTAQRLTVAARQRGGERHHKNKKKKKKKRENKPLAKRAKRAPVKKPSRGNKPGKRPKREGVGKNLHLNPSPCRLLPPRLIAARSRRKSENGEIARKGERGKDPGKATGEIGAGV